jgi:hypothetical protein
MAHFARRGGAPSARSSLLQPVNPLAGGGVALPPQQHSTLSVANSPANASAAARHQAADADGARSTGQRQPHARTPLAHDEPASQMSHRLAVSAGVTICPKRVLNAGLPSIPSSNSGFSLAFLARAFERPQPLRLADLEPPYLLFQA